MLNHLLLFRIKYSKMNEKQKEKCYDPDIQKLSKAEKRKRRRATPKYRHLHASRERYFLKNVFFINFNIS